MRALADSECVLGHGLTIRPTRADVGPVPDRSPINRLRFQNGPFVCAMRRVVYSGQLGRRFHIRRSRTAVRRRAGLTLRIKLGGFLDQHGRKLRIRRRSGELEKRRRLTGKIVLADHRYFPGTAQRIHDAETGDFVPAKCKKVYLSHGTRPGRPYVVGVPLLRSWETAVTSCAGANGLVKRTLLGTPCEPYSSALAPVI